MPVTAPPRQRKASAPRPGRGPERMTALILLGCPALLPAMFMAPAVFAYSTGTMHEAGNDVLGSGGALLLFAMLAVTPLVTLTGTRWFTPLRQWYGIMFAVTVIIDAVLAASDSSFAGGVAGRLAGHTFLATGFVMVLASVPLLATANRASMRGLGKYWRPVQRYGTYAIWGLLFIHLAFLEGPGYDPADPLGIEHQRLYQVAALSLPLLVLRLPPVARWVKGRRRAGRAWQAWLVLSPLLLLFAAAVFFLVNEELRKGVAAFLLHPAAD